MAVCEFTVTIGAKNLKATFSPRWHGEPGDKLDLETCQLTFIGHV
jgi:hypothetical protein